MHGMLADIDDSAYFPFGFPLSGHAWEEYRISALLAGPEPEVGNAAVFAVRALAALMNEKRDFRTYAVQPARAGHMLSLGLLTDVLRYVFDYYCIEENVGSLPLGLNWIAARHGAPALDQPSREFALLFPPKAVPLAGEDAHIYLESLGSPLTPREIVVREMVLLNITTTNPAALPYVELFDDRDLAQHAPYVPLVEELDRYFATQPPLAALGRKLFEALRAPMQAAPGSIEEQLEYVQAHWAAILPAHLLARLLLVRDILREENLMRGLGPGPTQVLQFGGLGYEYAIELNYPEPAHFTQDSDWMSNVVLIAKTVYVWLDQLSKKYQRSLTRLDQIPDEELDRLARWGFTGLWLIGVWERSPASQKIKQIMGNPEAVSSAYSLYDYSIAQDLGGHEAYTNLRDRAWQRGIRLASDMVPNHMGIYSKWVIEHPDWFIQLDYPPFPGYQFNGPDLSGDERVGLFIEDGYWDHRDAAVVFKRVDRWTGSTTYIYHGNDGTSMPWNDTAQLNLLIPTVREAVIQTILHVARQFPIIRFDAAMTLAKKHYQRLWFPQPGDGGAIPSRSEHGMTKPDFDAVFPAEFWREVVDRIQAEAPDTLLLAEAFWLMEGYFVRTLGMHRVYNSAFMNMLKMEENEKYRTTVKNVLEFTPEVLKRFVNFMNNPDERTAIEQFGREDKYYGVALLMVAMPGLPMFGHGQIEGFTEKYGMEYRRAYWDEQVDDAMVSRHEREIFPLMRWRHLFSGVEHFAFYDFVTADGRVDENVFAYSNRSGEDRALICYHNVFATTSGRVHSSVPMRQGQTEHDPLVRKSLGEALGLNTDPAAYYIFLDHRTGLEYLRRGEQLAHEGLFMELQAYQYHAFVGFREVLDTDGSLARLEARLQGRGVPSVTDAHRELVLAPILHPFREVVNAEMLQQLIQLPAQAAKRTALRRSFEAVAAPFLQAAGGPSFSADEIEYLVRDIWADIEVIAGLGESVKTLRLKKAVKDYFLAGTSGDPGLPAHLLSAWAICRQLGRLRAQTDIERESARCMEDWFLRKVLAEAFEQLEIDAWLARSDAQLVQLLVGHPEVLRSMGKRALSAVFDDVVAQRYLQVNRYQDKAWINKERLEQLVYGLFVTAAADILATPKQSKKACADHIEARFNRAAQIIHWAEVANYQTDGLLVRLA